jgi:hypothetical protein
MFLMMLPRNPFPENFCQLLDIFKTSRCIHHLIKLNLEAGANFALAWVQKWQRCYLPGVTSSQIKGSFDVAHMDATFEPAKRIIDWLLEADAKFFEEHHYLDPLLAGPAEQWTLHKGCITLYI